MPRILLSTAHITPLILESLRVDYTSPALVEPYPTLPKPFHVTEERIQRLLKVDGEEKYEAGIKGHLESAKKSFCFDVRSLAKFSSLKLKV